MPMTPEEKLELRQIVAGGVQQGLSQIGLGADNEEALAEVRKDTAWLRRRRLAEEDVQRIVRQSMVRLGLLGVAAVALFAVTHPIDFGTFVAKMFMHTTKGA